MDRSTLAIVRITACAFGSRDWRFGGSISVWPVNSIPLVANVSQETARGLALERLYRAFFNSSKISLVQSSSLKEGFQPQSRRALSS